MSETDADADTWDWGVLLDRDGNVIPPGASEPYRNKNNQTPSVKDDSDEDESVPRSALDDKR